MPRKRLTVDEFWEAKDSGRFKFIKTYQQYKEAHAEGEQVESERADQERDARQDKAKADKKARKSAPKFDDTHKLVSFNTRAGEHVEFYASK